jgi:hypothetical protein
LGQHEAPGVRAHVRRSRRTDDVRQLDHEGRAVEMLRCAASAH